MSRLDALFAVVVALLVGCLVGVFIGFPIGSQAVKDRWYARFRHATPDDVPPGLYLMPNGNFEIPDGMGLPSKPTVAPMPHAD